MNHERLAVPHQHQRSDRTDGQGNTSATYGV
jgi:hypothetical protein